MFLTLLNLVMMVDKVIVKAPKIPNKNEAFCYETHKNKI